MKDNKLIPVAQPDLRGNERKYVNKCLASSWISSKGEFIDKFEKDFAKFIGTKYAVATSNGTTALHLSLAALGIGSNDEVLVPDLTFIASANTISYTGAKAILVDVERQTWNIDPNQLEDKITPKTKAIMVVHLYGQPADMNKILLLAKKHNLFVIEDAAEAHGAEIKVQSYGRDKRKPIRHHGGGTEQSQSNFLDGGEIWKKVGSIGDIGCFSFYGNKIITTGEGGMIVTDNKKLAENIKILRDHGQTPTRRYYHEVIGFNYRMTNLQAAVGCAQLERIKEFIERKRKIAKFYNVHLKHIPGITLPPEVLWAKNVYWMYSILLDKPYSKTRDEIIDKMSRENIETRPFFYPIHSLPPYRENGYFPNSSYLSLHGLNLPSGVTLKKEDLVRVVEIIKKYSL